tara:strand:+ start:64 stop:522 length:459 start_codon:yes stop_codon:yes gene_type:complete
MILRYVSVKLTEPGEDMWGGTYSKVCITNGKCQGEEGDEKSCFTMALDEFNEHDWDKPLYDDVVATLLYEMPPKLRVHYEKCCEGNLEYEDGDYSDEMEVHFCGNCEMRWSLPVELVRHYDDVMPQEIQYTDAPDGITPHAYLKQLVQKDLY